MDDYIIVKQKYLNLIDEGFNYGEILLYCVILSYYENSQDCFISNDRFASMFHTSKRNIQLWLKKLKENNLIKYEYDNDRRYLVPIKKSSTR